MFEELLQEETAGAESLENGSRWKISGTGIVLGLLLVAHVVFNLVFFNPNSHRVDDYPFMMTVGVLLSQPILFSFWAAFAPQRFYHRFLWCLLLSTIVSFLEELGYMRHSHGDSGMMMILVWLLFLLATGVLLVVRRFTGWRIRHDREISLTTEYRASQFGIKHLLILTTITGLAAGLLRSVFMLSPRTIHIDSVLDFVGIIGCYFAMLLPVVLMPWYTLAYRAKFVVLLFFSIVVFVLMDTMVYWLSSLVIRPTQYYRILLFIQLGAALSMLITTLPLRFCGYRMVRS